MYTFVLLVSLRNVSRKSQDSNGNMLCFLTPYLFKVKIYIIFFLCIKKQDVPFTQNIFDLTFLKEG